MKQNKQFFRRLLAVAFWLAVWQAAAMAIGQEVFLVSPVQALRTLVQLLPRADFWAQCSAWCWRCAPPGGAPPMRCWLR